MDVPQYVVFDGDRLALRSFDRGAMLRAISPAATLYVVHECDAGYDIARVLQPRVDAASPHLGNPHALIDGSYAFVGSSVVRQLANGAGVPLPIGAASAIAPSELERIVRLVSVEADDRGVTRSE